MVINTYVDNNFIEKHSDAGSWYLLQCKPREETRANVNLKNQGFTTFLPELSIAKKTKPDFRSHNLRAVACQALYPALKLLVGMAEDIMIKNITLNLYH